MHISPDIQNDFTVMLENHGERMVPAITGGSTFWEHIYRYAFACRYVRGKRVLDIACGEGYGAAALQNAGAAHVIGVDISEDVCRHSRARYGLDARQGSAEQIPLPDGSVDIVVSFETIEHTRGPRRFLDECARVLVPGGHLIISTPNEKVYAKFCEAPNPHHCSEMTEEEFTLALAARFHIVRLYSQRPYEGTLGGSQAATAGRSLLSRGSRRLYRLARSFVFPRAVHGPTARQRDGVVDEILAASRGLANPFNPYAVRGQGLFKGEQRVYFVAHAIRADE